MRAAKLAKCLKVLEEYEREHGGQGMGSVLICFFGVLLFFCFGVHGLTFGSLTRNGLLERKLFYTLVDSWSQTANPLNPKRGFFATANIEGGFAKFEPSQWVTKEIAVAYEPVGSEKLAAGDNGVNVFKRDFLSIRKSKFWKCIRFLWFYYDFVQDHPRSGVPFIVGNIGQVFTAENDRPPLKERWGLSVVFNHYFDSGILQKCRNIRSSRKAVLKLFDRQCWNRYARCNICTRFGSVGASKASIRNCLGVGNIFFQRSSLLRHLGNLFMHSPQLTKVKVNLSPHFSNLKVHSLQRFEGYSDASETDSDQGQIDEVCRQKQFMEIAWRLCEMAVLLPLGGLLVYYEDRPATRIGRILASGCGLSFIGIAMGLGFLPVYHREGRRDNDNPQHLPHTDKLYHKKFLTNLTLCNTFSGVANVLSADKQIAIIAALAEGSSIRSIERITGIHSDTIMRLGVRVGKGCEMLLDCKMQDLDCNFLQFDEVWGFIGKEERHVSVDDDPELGDVWTYCAIDSETKLVPSFKCGKRTLETTTEFVQDVASRMRHRVQISSDAMHSYIEAMEQAFGADVDYGQCVKVYAHNAAQHPDHKYSAPSLTSAHRRPIAGTPEMEFVSTSHIERLNGTTRLHIKRLSRLTLAFSKKLDNFKAAVALHFAYYNFVRRYATLRCTPAMATGIERDFWSVADLVEAVS